MTLIQWYPLACYLIWLFLSYSLPRGQSTGPSTGRPLLRQLESRLQAGPPTEERRPPPSPTSAQF